MARSDPFIAAIAASRSRSPSARFLLARASAFSSWARAFIAARSSAVNPLDVLVLAVVLFADFCVLFVTGFLAAMRSTPSRTTQLLDADQVPVPCRIMPRGAGGAYRSRLGGMQCAPHERDHLAL